MMLNGWHMDKCAACSRRAMPGNKYCTYHAQALARLADHYKTWVSAYGSISWDGFMARLSKMQETGDWVKEVIAAEMKKEG
jgi:hypothetical protein